MSARAALSFVAVFVGLELVLILLLPHAGRLNDLGVAWNEPLRRIAPIAALFSEGSSMGVRTILLAVGLALVPIKGILVAIAAAQASETPDMRDFVNLPSNYRASIGSRIASGFFLVIFATMLIFFVLGYVFSSASERDALFIIFLNGGFKYWLVWHGVLFTLLGGVLGLCACWVWDGLQVIRRAVTR